MGNSEQAVVSAKSAVVIAMDIPIVKKTKGKTETSYERGYFLCRGEDLLRGNFRACRRVTRKTLFMPPNDELFKEIGAPGASERVVFVVYPTKTYSSGFGGDLFTDLAPEDRALRRKLGWRYGGAVADFKVSLKNTTVFEKLSGYLASEEERKRYQGEKSTYQIEDEKVKKKTRQFPIGFDVSLLRNIKPIFKSCMTRPNRQDYFYLVTKAFGLNLGVRLTFAVIGVLRGELPLVRAVLGQAWYQLQDVVFTIFGQTYMKFLGRMTGLLRVFHVYIGDFFFVYVQFSFFEFLNRLILGPLGENPLVYTPEGIGLILLNNLQGLLSGGPLMPAINKIRKAGVISHSLMMHFYQLGSLCFYFGQFASYGYQTIYLVLTTSVMAFAWGSYILFSVFFKDPSYQKVEDREIQAKLDAMVAVCYASV